MKESIKGITMISVELDSNFNSEQINNIHEHEAADNCFLVFIGGKYIQVLDQVIEKVKTISKKIGLHPLGLLISLKNNDNPSQLKKYADGADFPLVICKVNNDLWDNLYYKFFTYLQHFLSNYILQQFFLDPTGSLAFTLLVGWLVSWLVTAL